MTNRLWKISVLVFLATTLTVGFGVFGKSPKAFATNPQTISFQGKVVNSSGTNVADGTYSFVFKLYTASSGGTAIWTETDSLTVTAGVFQVNLGAVTSLSSIDFNANPSLYLGITFNSDPAGEMTPRVQLNSVPYAFNADKVGGLTASQLVQLSPGSQQTGSINVSSTGTFGGALSAVGVNSNTGLIQGTGGETLTGTLQDTGTVTVQNGTYTSNEVLINDGQTSAPPAFPNSYTPALTVITNETSGSRPLFFAYNSGSAYAALIDAGACGAFTQMCFDLGNGGTSDTALENVGTTLNVGGGDDGNFATTALLSTATTVSGTLGVTGVASLNGGTLTTTITTSGAINGATLTSSSLTFSGASANTISGTSGQALTVASQGAGRLTLTSGSGIIGIGSATLQSTLGGTQTIDLDAASVTTLQLENSTGGADVANLNLYNGALETGTTPVVRLTNAGALSNITGIGVTSGNVTIAQAAANQFIIQASAAPTTDMADITNTGFPITTTGINAEQIDYYAALTAASSQASSLRLNITNTSTVATSNTDGLEVVATISGATGTTDGISIDATTAGTGTGNALAIGTGWTNVIQSTNFTVTGTGQIEGKGFNYFDPSTLTEATGATGLESGGTTGGNFGGVFDAGAFIGSDDTYDQEFVGSIAAATTNNATAGDDGLWYFNNNAQASITGADISTTGGYYEMSAPATTARGSILTLGNTPGTQDKPIAAANLPIIQMKVRTSAARATDDVYFGAMDTATAVVTNDALPTNGMYFWTDNSTGTTGWQGVVRSAGATVGTVTCPTTADVTAGQFAVGRIVVVNTTTVRFFMDSSAATGGVNFIDCGTVTGTLPTAAMAPEIQLIQTVATATTVDVDYARFWQDDAAPATPDQDASDVSSEETQADISTGADDDSVDASQVSSDTSTSDNSGLTPVMAGNSDNSSASAASDITAGPAGSDLSVNAINANSFSISNGSGQTVATIDDGGNATFSGALNAASATLSGGLTVGGDLNVAGLSTFQKLATFIARTVFKQDVEIDGHLTVGSDTAGYAALRQGESSVNVTFQKPYDTPPVVNVSPTDGQFLSTSVSNVTTQGFTITLASPATADTTLSWTALDVSNPQTATNPTAPAVTTANSP